MFFSKFFLLYYTKNQQRYATCRKKFLHKCKAHLSRKQREVTSRPKLTQQVLDWYQISCSRTHRHTKFFYSYHGRTLWKPVSILRPRLPHSIALRQRASRSCRKSSRFVCFVSQFFSVRSHFGGVGVKRLGSVGGGGSDCSPQHASVSLAHCSRGRYLMRFWF